MPLASTAIYYASEARGYSGMMLGFCALALLSWQRICSSSRKRAYWLCTLFIACAMAVSGHYYAILFIGALRSEDRTNHTIGEDSISCMACILRSSHSSARLPLDHPKRNLLFSSLLGNPDLEQSARFLPGMLGPLANILLLGAILFLIAALRSDSDGEIKGERILRHFSTYEVVAWACIIAVPFFAMFLAKTVTHGYTDRYALSGLIGAIVALCHLGFAVAPRPRSFSAPAVLRRSCFTSPCTESQPFAFRRSMSAGSESRCTCSDRRLRLRSLPDITIFHRVSFYSPRSLIQNAWLL